MYLASTIKKTNMINKEMFQVRMVVWMIFINCCVLSLCLLILTVITTMSSLSLSRGTLLTSLPRLPTTNRKTRELIPAPHHQGEADPGSVRSRRKLSERGEMLPTLGRGGGWTRWPGPTAGWRRSCPTTRTLIPRSRLWIRSDIPATNTCLKSMFQALTYIREMMIMLENSQWVKLDLWWISFL